MLASALSLCWGQPASAQSTPAITTRFVHLANGVPGVLYAPAVPGPKAATAVFIMHSSADYLSFPPPFLSLRWYQRFLGTPSWRQSIAVSAQVALLTMVFATVLGLLASLALVRGRFRGKGVIYRLRANGEAIVGPRRRRRLRRGCSRFRRGFRRAIVATCR